MRVCCPECGAEYQFSSQVIPPEGYDAQCTNCSTVFFVAQEVTHPRINISDLERIVTVGCPACNAQYQFPAIDIPPGGYDAECNQCGQVFFVTDDKAEGNEDDQVIGNPEPVDEVEEGLPDADLLDHDIVAMAAADTLPGRPDAEDTSPNAKIPGDSDRADTSPNAQRPIDPLDGPTMTQEDFESEFGSSGAPDLESADLTDADPSDPDFVESDSEVTEQNTMKVRLRDDERAALEDGDDDEPEILDEAEFEEIPEADPSLLEDITVDVPIDDSLSVPEPPLPESVGVQQPVRRQTAPSPVMPEPIETDRVIAYDGGANDDDDDIDIDFGNKRGGWLKVAVAAMVIIAAAVGWSMLSTDPVESEEFLAHIENGRQALRADTDAGYQAAVTSFRAALEITPKSAEASALLGLAKIMRGTNVEERGLFMVEYGNRLNRQLKELNGGSKKKAAELTEQIKSLSSESTALFQTGQKDISDGFEALRQALQVDATNPVVLDAASLYYSISKDNLSESQDLAKEGLAQRGLDPASFDWKAPPSPWSGLAMSEVRAGLDSDSETASQILDALVQSDPKLHRARFELAQIHFAENRLPEARTQVEAVLAMESGHERAAVWIERLDRIDPDSAKVGSQAVATAQAVQDDGSETGDGPGATDDAITDPDELDKKKKLTKKKRPRKKRRRKKR